MIFSIALLLSAVQLVSGAAASPGDLTMDLTWNYSCTPYLLPLKRTFHLEYYPDKELLKETVARVEKLAQEGNYGMAVLQWYNATTPAAQPEYLLEDVKSDLNFVIAQPGAAAGLQCLETAVRGSKNQTNETSELANTLESKIKEAKNAKPNSKSSSGMASTSYQLTSDDEECKNKDQAKKEDCEKALDMLKDGVDHEQQVQYGTCYIVYNGTDVEEMKQTVEKLMNTCIDARKVAGQALKKWGNICLTSRFTSC